MDYEKFKQLLAEGRQVEAQELLEEFLSSSISSREQGKALITVASMHMEAQNTINEEYLRILKNAVQELNELKKQDSNITDAVNLAKARKFIDKS